jgi:hypothetical protein
MDARQRPERGRADIGGKWLEHSFGPYDWPFVSVQFTNVFSAARIGYACFTRFGGSTIDTPF